LAFFADYFIIKNKLDAFIDLFFAIITIIAYFVIFLKKDIKVSALTLFWIASLIEVIYFYTHSIDYKIILMMLIPIIIFFILNKKETIINLFLFYLLMISVFVYAFFNTPQNKLLNEPSFLLSFLIANIFILSFGIFLQLSIQEYVKKLKESNKIKELLINEIHHRVKNNLNLISSILGLQLKNAGKEGRKLIKSNQKRVEAMALLHKILYTKGIECENNFRQYVKDLIDNLIVTANKEIKVEKNIQSVHLDLDDMVSLGVILNELITNSIKHSNSDILEIEIEFKKDKMGFILNYCDNSKNIDLENLTKGFGFNLILMSVEGLDGKIEYFSDDKNLCYRISLPYLGEVK
jgi:two-component sensor histidine kinase